MNTKVSPKESVDILRRISRKFQISSNPSAWEKRGCYYTGSTKNK